MKVFERRNVKIPIMTHFRVSVAFEGILIGKVLRNKLNFHFCITNHSINLVSIKRKRLGLFVWTSIQLSPTTKIHSPEIQPIGYPITVP